MFRLPGTALIFASMALSAIASTPSTTVATGSSGCPGEDGTLELAGRPTGLKGRQRGAKRQLAERCRRNPAGRCREK